MMFSVPVAVLCIAGAAVIVLLAAKIFFLYRDLEAIGEQFGECMEKDTNNRIYVPGNDRHIKAFAERMNRELGVLYESRRRYQNGDRELKEAVTNISHDLRTPLTALYGYLELAEAELERECESLQWESGESEQECESLNGDKEGMRQYRSLDGVPECKRNTLDAERVGHYLAQIRNRADAMRALTEELFRYSIILSRPYENTGALETQPNARMDAQSDMQKVVLNRMLADCLLSYYDIFIQKRIEPQVSIADEQVVRYLDTNALKRVFCNILDNAVKYSTPASDTRSGNTGQVQAVLAVELLSDGTITFCNSAKDLDWVSVARLFDRYYTVETGRNSTGLGLSIAKLLTERMGGSISAAYMDGMLKIVMRL